MIRETELSLFVPSPELLVRFASAVEPLGMRAGPPRLKLLRETFFDTPDEALRARGMTCKLRQEEGKDPLVVVTMGEGPDTEGITSRLRLMAAAVGAGVFETLRGDSEPAEQIRKLVDPGQLRPKIALDIRRLSRIHRTRVLQRPVFYLCFDRITVQMGAASAEFQELRVRRRREGGPRIKEVAQRLRDTYHLFPDGLSTLQRAHRVLALERRSVVTDLSPYALSLVLALFQAGCVGLVRKDDHLSLPTFRGSGEDAARALLADLTDQEELPLLRLGTTEIRDGRPTLEVWACPDPGAGSVRGSGKLVWVPWHELVEAMGTESLIDRTLLSALLLLTRRRLLGQMPWIPPFEKVQAQVGIGRRGVGAEDEAQRESMETSVDGGPPSAGDFPHPAAARSPELEAVDSLYSLLGAVESSSAEVEARMGAVSELSRELASLYLEGVAGLKGRILSEEADENGLPPIHLLDLVSVRVRGILDRLYQCLNRELLPALEGEGIHLRDWIELKTEDRRKLLEEFEARWIPRMAVAQEWGPAFIPEMPPAGCAVGLGVRGPLDGPFRFFHHILSESVPSFFRVPDTSLFVPLEEVILGHLLNRKPELRESEGHLFRFTTGEVTVRIPRAERERSGEDGPGNRSSNGGPPDERAAWDLGPPPSPVVQPWSPPSSSQPSPDYEEVSESIVTRVLVKRSMPETFQAHLIRALERQVTRRKPLIGWSDLYVVRGPLDLVGISGVLNPGEPD